MNKLGNIQVLCEWNLITKKLLTSRIASLERVKKEFANCMLKNVQQSPGKGLMNLKSSKNDKAKWLKEHPLSSEDQQVISAALEAHSNKLHEQFNNNKNKKTQQPVGITKTNKRSMRLTECCFDESLKASLLSKFDSKNR